MSTWVAIIGVARFVWTRHKLLLGGCLVFYIAAYSASELLAQQIEPWLDGLYPLMRFAPVLVPLFVFVTTKSAFTLDLAGTESRFPVHFLALPLNSRQLALPFMMGAVLVAAALWAAGFAITDGRLLTGPAEVPPHLRGASTGVDTVPFLLASGVAWIQAFIWMSFSRRGIRVWILVAMVVAHFVLLVLMAGHTLSVRATSLICVASLAIAGGVGTWGVARARRGDPVVEAERRAESPTRKRSRIKRTPSFASPLAAQAWFEWQAHGARHRSPFLLLVPLILSLLITLTFAMPWDPAAAAAPALVARAGANLVFIGGILFGITVLGGPSVASFRSTISWTHNDDFAIPAFFAALPLSTGQLAWTKMKTGVRATASLIFVIVLLSALFTCVFQQLGLWAVVFETLRERHGLVDTVLRMVLVPVGLALFLLGCAANVVWTALMGRGWKVMYVALTAIGLGLFMLVTASTKHPEWFGWVGPTLRALLPWLVVAKIGALAWLAHRVAQHRHYSIARVASILVVWVVAVVAAWGIGLRLRPEADIELLYLIIVAMPVLGILGAPLAMQINRTG
jgi:hypothetical protein